MSLPETDIDAVVRMRALAAGVQGAVLLETVLDAPFEDVWAIAGDLEHGTPQIEAGITAVEIVERDGDRLEAVTHNRLGLTARFDAVLRPGWCVMNSSWGSIGMAASAIDATHTRFAHYEAARWLGPLAPLILRPKIRGDFARLRVALARGPR